MLKNDRLIKALKREAVDKTPVWLMRQAGRYLPEYRKVRSSVSGFLELCETPELACEVTLQPLRRFDLDAAILFSDILILPRAMGLELDFVKGEGPVFNNPVKTAKDIKNLKNVNADTDMAFTLDACKLISKELDNKVPLIGFAGSPWTVATYMVEGASSKSFSKVKAMLYRDPDLLHELLNKIMLGTIDLLKAQIKNGASVAMLFDSWGGVLTPRAYREFSLHYMNLIVKALAEDPATKDIPVILFTKGGALWLEDMAKTNCAALGLDWSYDIGAARERVGNSVALQGNLDPSVLYASEDRIQQSVARILADFGSHRGHVFNFGHGIHPEIDPGKVKFLVDAVHELSGHYH